MTQEQIQRMQFQQALLSALLASPKEVHVAVEEVRRRADRMGNAWAAREAESLLRKEVSK